MKKNILNIFGLGKTKYSASTASLLAAAVYLLLCKLSAEPYIIHVILFIAVLAACIFSLLKNKSYAGQDAKEIVADEFLGMYICLLIAGTQRILPVILLFVAFRILDNFKFPPFSTLDKIKNGFGVMADDIAIGIFLGILFRLVMRYMF